MEKAAITADLVAQLIAKRFPQWADLPVRPIESDGWDNTTFRLGEEMTVRLPSADRYSAQVDKEHRSLPVLAGQLSLRIPTPLAKGEPDLSFPRPWSVYGWLPGIPATSAAIADRVRLATDLAGFLAALYAIDPGGGPPAGAHNFYRGGPVATYDAEARELVDALGRTIDSAGAMELWDAALESTWTGPPVWVLGDVAAGTSPSVRHPPGA